LYSFGYAPTLSKDPTQVGTYNIRYYNSWRCWYNRSCSFKWNILIQFLTIRSRKWSIITNQKFTFIEPKSKDEMWLGIFRYKKPFSFEKNNEREMYWGFLQLMDWNHNVIINLNHRSNNLKESKSLMCIFSLFFGLCSYIY